MELADYRFPIFVHAWFRSGSTYIWGKLRKCENLICYYEPFHEVLAEPSLLEQIENNHTPLETSLSLRHPVEDRHYFFEYQRLLRESRLHFVPELSYDHYFLAEDEQDPERFKYIDTLIAFASEEARSPVFCFCRSQMRSAWIKRQFKGTHVAQIREPLSQYRSFGVLPYFRTTMIKTALDLWRTNPRCFSHIPNFDRFAAAFERRAGLPPDQLYEFFLKPEDFMAIFFLIWSLSALQSISACDLVLDIDRLAADESYQGVVRNWFSNLGCDVDFSDCAIPFSNATNDKTTHELIVRTGRALRDERCGLLICDADRVRNVSALLSDETSRVLTTLITE
jgi:hypothetical protein